MTEQEHIHNPIHIQYRILLDSYGQPWTKENKKRYKSGDLWTNTDV